MALDRWANLFARSAGASAETLFADVPRVHPETIRRARVRADVLAMNLHRAMMSRYMVEMAQLDVYLFVDSSQQWSQGLEVFAASYDMVEMDNRRRPFLLICIDRCLMDVTGTSTALLWAIWLLVGPSVVSMRWFCNRVRGICSDMGTERLIVDVPDVLPDFLVSLNERYNQGGLTRGQHLFPRALHMPGWRHKFDNLLRQALSTLSFFLSWLTLFICVVSFLRDAGNTSILAKRLKEVGAGLVADLLRRASIPSLAQWRWSRLRDCLEGVDTFVESLRQNFLLEWYDGVKDRSRVDKVIQAFTTQRWLTEFKLVFWMCRWLVSLQSWGGGCDCHAEERAQGKTVECWFKGRRLPRA